MSSSPRDAVTAPPSRPECAPQEEERDNQYSSHSPEEEEVHVEEEEETKKKKSFERVPTTEGERVMAPKPKPISHPSTAKGSQIFKGAGRSSWRPRSKGETNASYYDCQDKWYQHQGRDEERHQGSHGKGKGNWYGGLVAASKRSRLLLLR